MIVRGVGKSANEGMRNAFFSAFRRLSLPGGEAVS
jgi:hypothetical protein